MFPCRNCGTQIKLQNWFCTQTCIDIYHHEHPPRNSDEITKALKVLILTEYTRKFLRLNDPMALRQAIQALTEANQLTDDQKELVDN